MSGILVLKKVETSSKVASGPVDLVLTQALGEFALELMHFWKTHPHFTSDHFMALAQLLYEYEQQGHVTETASPLIGVADKMMKVMQNLTNLLGVKQFDPDDFVHTLIDEEGQTTLSTTSNLPLGVGDLLKMGDSGIYKVLHVYPEADHMEYTVEPVMSKKDYETINVTSLGDSKPKYAYGKFNPDKEL
jgi:hypothetical protein